MSPPLDQGKAINKLREYAAGLRSLNATDWRLQEAINQHYQGRAALTLFELRGGDPNNDRNPPEAVFTADIQRGKVSWETLRRAAGADLDFLLQFDKNEMPLTDAEIRRREFEKWFPGMSRNDDGPEGGAGASDDEKLQWYARQALEWADAITAEVERLEAPEIAKRKKLKWADAFNGETESVRTAYDVAAPRPVDSEIAKPKALKWADAISGETESVRTAHNVVAPQPVDPGIAQRNALMQVQDIAWKLKGKKMLRPQIRTTLRSEHMDTLRVANPGRAEDEVYPGNSLLSKWFGEAEARLKPN